MSYNEQEEKVICADCGCLFIDFTGYGHATCDDCNRMAVAISMARFERGRVRKLAAVEKELTRLEALLTSDLVSRQPRYASWYTHIRSRILQIRCLRASKEVLSNLHNGTYGTDFDEHFNL